MFRHTLKRGSAFKNAGLSCHYNLWVCTLALLLFAGTISNWGMAIFHVNGNIARKWWTLIRTFIWWMHPCACLPTNGWFYGWVRGWTTVEGYLWPFKQHGVKIHQERASCQYINRINSTISQNGQIYTYLWERQNLQWLPVVCCSVMKQRLIS